VRQPDRPFLLRDSALDVALRIRPHVLLHRHHVLDQHLAFVGKHAQHAPFFSRIPASHHLHCVVPADINAFMYFLGCSSHFNPSKLSILKTGSPRLYARPKALPAPATQSSKTSSRAVLGPPDQKRACPPV